MIFGISTSAMGTEKNPKRFEEFCIRAKEARFEEIEVILEGPIFHHSCMSNEVIKIIKEQIIGENLKLRFHAPFYSINLASFDIEFRKLAIKEIKNSLQLANKLGAYALIFHPGLCFLPCKLDKHQALKILNRSLGILLKLASEYDILLLIENRGSEFDIITEPKDLITLFENQNYPSNLRINFDVVQAQLIMPPHEYYNEISDLVFSAHIRDSPRDRDDLLPVGSGDINWHQLIRSFKRKNFLGPFIMEVGNFKNALLSKEIFEKIMKSDD